ncbi:hypothetical protein DFQ30_008141 [Apophysomyces sp. BC1015]|nr:hypothetical protein DFQ30_008141 [Apophysomyces sp. BC1015]
MCGIVGAISQSPVNQLIYDSLLLLQHRGQDAAGIATINGNTFHMHKANGMVRDVFRTRNMRSLPGNCGIGQVRYPTAGSASSAEEAQPFYVNAPFGVILAHNGNVTNWEQLKDEMFRIDRRHINTRSDSEVLLNVLAHELQLATTGFSLEPEAIFKAVAGGVEWMIASESVALEGIGFEFVRDIAPGEAIFIGMDGTLHAKQCARNPSLNPCIFELVYLARPDSVLDGVPVYNARLRMGDYLAEKIKRTLPGMRIDVVMPIPDSSRPAAMQVAKKLNIEYREGFFKNRYLVAHGRTDEEVARLIGADVLVYQDVEDMKQAVRDTNPQLENFEASCFDGRYITGDVTTEYLSKIERERLNPASQSDRDAAGDGNDRSQLHLHWSVE